MQEEIQKDKEALELRWPYMETKMDAKRIADMDTNLKNLNREMYAIMERMTIQAEELTKVIKEQSFKAILKRHKK